jgi:hypothetical protein
MEPDNILESEAEPGEDDGTIAFVAGDRQRGRICHMTAMIGRSSLIGFGKRAAFFVRQ